MRIPLPRVWGNSFQEDERLVELGLRLAASDLVVKCTRLLRLCCAGLQCRIRLAESYLSIIRDEGLLGGCLSLGALPGW
jgi:hypothetical protein